MVEASYPPGPHRVLAPTMAIRGVRTAGGLTLAASEGVWLTRPLSRVGDYWVLCTRITLVTGAEKCTGKNAYLCEGIIFIGMVRCLPILAEYVLVA